MWCIFNLIAGIRIPETIAQGGKHLTLNSSHSVQTTSAWAFSKAVYASFSTFTNFLTGKNDRLKFYYTK